MQLRIFFTAFLLLTLTLFSGCKSDEVLVYTIPKEKPFIAKMDPATHTESQLHWKAPASWKELPADGMRAGAYEIDSLIPNHAPVQFTIVSLPGKSGGLLQNINRWRGQIGLSPLVALKAEDAQSLKLGKNEYTLVQIFSDKKEEANCIFVAILEQGDTSWFFKLQGDQKTVLSETVRFKEFLSHVHN